MITIGFSTRKIDNEFISHLKETCGIPKVEILPVENSEGRSLTKVYNELLDRATNDIVVLCHDDIILSKGWGKRVLSHFNESDFGILGLAGTTHVSESGRWWDDMTKMVGIVSHSHEGRTWESRYSSNYEKEIIQTVMVDGLFIAIHKGRIKNRFDESIEGFHFYDIDFTLGNHLEGVKVGVMFDFKITHKSIGITNDEWEKNRFKFTSKYSEILPVKIVPEITFKDRNIKLKESPKIGIIIPTKGKLELLFQCIKSIYESDSYRNFKIYIADTGSSDDELTQLKEFAKSNSDIKVIEYDYYNFAQINNDVVNNHIDDDVELLLFCNNDIKLINNAITRMVDTYNKNKNSVGTIGARLHYEDNTIQHSGITMFLDRNGGIRLTHYGLRSYYTYHQHMVKDILGNTAAFMLISKQLFQSIGGFNENYLECFEDVELNINCILRNRENIIIGDAVCYHYESQTRNDDEDKLKRQGEDYVTRLIPKIINSDKTYKYFSNISETNFRKLLSQQITIK